MAVTHADLAPSRRSMELGSKLGAILIILTILCGLFCFILCLIAEATRSEVTWMVSDTGKGRRHESCVYSSSGKTPLLCATTAFLGLATAMVMEHIYLLIAVSKYPPPSVLIWDPNLVLSKVLAWQAGFFFVLTWLCFAVGEILLLIGLSVESGHLKDWSTPKPSCISVRQGLFSAAGVFGLATVFLAGGLYITALRIQRLCQQQEIVRQEMLAASVLYASPPASPDNGIGTNGATSENPIAVRQDQNERQTLNNKNSSLA